MVRILLLLLSLAACTGTEPVAAAPGCPAAPPEVSIDLQAPQPVLDNTLPQPALQSLAGNDYHEGRTMGLYKAKLEVKARTEMGWQDSARGVCVWIHRIKVDLTVSERTIYVVRERAPGSCGYDVVLGHERKHQAVDDALLAQYLPRVKQAVRDAVAGAEAASPVPAAQREAVQARLGAAVNAGVQAGFNELMAERARRQQEVDSPGEYRRVSEACR